MTDYDKAMIATRVAEVFAAVGAHFDLSQAELRGRSRIHAVARPRQMALWLCMDHYDMSANSIAKFVKMDHSTVLHAARQSEARYAAMPEWRDATQRVKSMLSMEGDDKPEIFRNRFSAAEAMVRRALATVKKLEADLESAQEMFRAARSEMERLDAERLRSWERVRRNPAPKLPPDAFDDQPGIATTRKPTRCSACRRLHYPSPRDNTGLCRRCKATGNGKVEGHA